LNNKRITLIFGFLIALVSLFFLLYPPVSFLITKSNMMQIASRIILVLFFLLVLLITVFSLWDLSRTNSKYEKTFADILDILANINKTNVENKFLTIRKGFEKTFLEPAWLNYEKSIRRIRIGITPEGDVREKYFATIDASYFFNDNLLDNNGRTVPYAVHRYFPQMLIALGIFGTFLGLVVGLTGIDFHDTANTKSSIEILLSGIQISFRTSLYGIAFSILLTSYQNTLAGFLESNLHHLINAIDELFPMNTQEDGINEIYQELEKQTASIQKMGTEIAEGVGNRFDSSIQDSLVPILSNLEAVTKQMITSTAKNNQDVINAIVNNIGSIITSSTQSELANLQESLSIITEKNKEMFESFNQSVSRMQGINDEQRAIMAESSTSMLNLGQVNNEMSLLHDKLSNLTDSLDLTVNRQNESQRDYTQLLEQVKENIGLQSRSNEVFENVVSQNIELSKIQQEVIGNLVSVTDSLNLFSKEVPTVLSALNQNMGEFEELSARVSSQLLSTIERLESTYDNINLSIAEISATFDHSMGVLGDEVTNQLTTINDSYIDIAEKLQVFSQETNVFIDEMKDFVGEQRNLHNLWNGYKSSFDSLNQEINEGITNYSTTVSLSLRDIFAQYDESVTRVLSSFKSTLDEFNDNIEYLHEVLENHLSAEIE
jgi:predicted nuclease with TOPRIM domain